MSFRFFILTFVFFQVAFSFAQEPKTIRVKKESNLAKAVFDNVDLRLMPIDIYGNPKENSIVNYKLYVKNKKETKEFTGYSNQLTSEMINYLNKQTKSVKLFFTEISVKDDSEHLIKLPDVIDVWFPKCNNCNQGKGKRKG